MCPGKFSQLKLPTDSSTEKEAYEAFRLGGDVARIPERKFGFAAAFEAGDFTRASVIPREQLPGGGIAFAVVEIAQKRRGGQASNAKVEDEVDEGVELTLGQRGT